MDLKAIWSQIHRELRDLLGREPTDEEMTAAWESEMGNLFERAEHLKRIEEDTRIN